MARCISNSSILLSPTGPSTAAPRDRIIVPVFCACMIAARGLAAIVGDLVRRLINRKKFSDTTTEPIVTGAQLRYACVPVPGANHCYPEKGSL